MAGSNRLWCCPCSAGIRRGCAAHSDSDRDNVHHGLSRNPKKERPLSASLADYHSGSVYIHSALARTTAYIYLSVRRVVGVSLAENYGGKASQALGLSVDDAVMG